MPGVQRQPVFRRLIAQRLVQNFKGKLDRRLGLKGRWGACLIRRSPKAG